MVRIGAIILTKDLEGVQEYLESFSGINKESILIKKVDDTTTDIDVCSEAKKKISDFSILFDYLKQKALFFLIPM